MTEEYFEYLDNDRSNVRDFIPVTRQGVSFRVWLIPENTDRLDESEVDLPIHYQFRNIYSKVGVHIDIVVCEVGDQLGISRT